MSTGRSLGFFYPGVGSLGGLCPGVMWICLYECVYKSVVLADFLFQFFLFSILSFLVFLSVVFAVSVVYLSTKTIPKHWP